MTTRNSDSLVMLFSTDWFFDLWATAGVCVSARERLKVQTALRKAVKTMMGNEQIYWNIAFDDGRVKQTTDAYMAAFSLGGLEAPFQTRSQEQLKTLALFENLTNLILHEAALGDVPQEAFDIISTVKSFWMQAEESQMSFFDVCKSSVTNWDNYIKDLSPDLPCATADFARENFENPSKVVEFIRIISSELSREKLSTLIMYYEKIGSELTNCQQKFDFLR